MLGFLFFYTNCLDVGIVWLHWPGPAAPPAGHGVDVRRDSEPAQLVRRTPVCVPCQAIEAWGGSNEGLNWKQKVVMYLYFVSIATRA